VVPYLTLEIHYFFKSIIFFLPLFLSCMKSGNKGNRKKLKKLKPNSHHDFSYLSRVLARLEQREQRRTSHQHLGKDQLFLNPRPHEDERELELESGLESGLELELKLELDEPRFPMVVLSLSGHATSIGLGSTLTKLSQLVDGSYRRYGCEKYDLVLDLREVEYIDPAVSSAVYELLVCEPRSSGRTRCETYFNRVCIVTSVDDLGTYNLIRLTFKLRKRRKENENTPLLRMVCHDSEVEAFLRF